MARIITKELALKIVEKFNARKVESKGKAHDLYAVKIDGQRIAMLSIRRSSEKGKGHICIPRDLHISPNQAKRLGQCPWKYKDLVQEMRDKGLIQAEPKQAKR